MSLSTIQTSNQASLVTKAEDRLKRSLSADEAVNIKTDALHMALFLMDKVAELENRIYTLEHP